MGIIFLLQDTGALLQGLKQLLAAQPFPQRFRDEGAAPALSDQAVDCFDQVVGQDEVSSYSTYIVP